MTAEVDISKRTAQVQ